MRALKGAEFEDVGLVGKAIHLLATTYCEMKTGGGLDVRDTFEIALGEGYRGEGCASARFRSVRLSQSNPLKRGKDTVRQRNAYEKIGNSTSARAG